MNSLFIILSIVLYQLFPQHAQSEVFKYNFDSFQVSTAEYEKGPTGMTLFYFPKISIGAVDIRGGAAAVSESSSVDPLNTWGTVDGIVLTGGSTFGLASIAGVMSSISALRGGTTDFDLIPSVPGAVVYDYRGRNNNLYPDKSLGEKAFKALASNKVNVGRAGAGANISVGKYFGNEYAEKSGQGAAFVEVNKIKFFVLTVLNAVGAIHDASGKVIKGNRDPKTGERKSTYDMLIGQMSPVSFTKKENTTISIIITNAKISRNDLQRLAAMTHTSMASMIRPFHTPWDGDTLFAVSTQEVDLPTKFSVADMGVLSSKLMEDAILSAIK